MKSARPLGVSVEAEVGSVGGSALETAGMYDIKNILTDPDEALDFAERTNVDALAISFGNSHGKYKGTPMLDYDRVKKISELVDIPLVMHGASGLNDSEYKRLIECGISKINFYTAIARKEAQNIREKTMNADEDILVTHNLMKWNIEFHTQETMKLMDLLKSSGMAK